jgi:heparan-alpha-glucosaminide N-acetyltransferase
MSVAGSIPVSPQPARITSIDALRGFTMFMMIFVNDLAGAGKIVPDWMVHYSERHSSGSGMTFVDLVFPAFLFIVGMSLPIALGAQLRKGVPLWKILRHILIRTISLFAIGVLMVNDEQPPDPVKTGCSAALWATLMYLAAICAFCDLSFGGPAAGQAPRWRIVSRVLQTLGVASLVVLAFIFVGPDGQRIITLSPFVLHHEWWGILGLIGWSYLVGAIVFLVFRANRTALLGCMVLLFCLYPADKTGAFEGFWLARHVGIGGSLGAHAALTVAGLLLATMLVGTDMTSLQARVRFTLLFMAGTAAAAWLVNGLYGIWKNNATPSWCLWACAITAALWLLMHFVADVRPVGFVARPLAVAGKNVLLAYLLSEMLPSALELLNLGDWYGRLAEPDVYHAVVRSATCGVIVLGATVGLNRLGFRLKL